MPNEFNAKDIFDIAVKIEQNGASFYRKAAEKVTGETNKTFLEYLARMEDDHELIFSKMAQSLTKEEGKATTFDPDEENSAYLKALADTRVFFEKKEPESDMRSILVSAVQAEKDSIVFYLGMKELIPEKKGQSKLDDIIKEEMGHIRLLAGTLSRLKD
jgi:rubrerythrin